MTPAGELRAAAAEVQRLVRALRPGGSPRFIGDLKAATGRLAAAATRAAEELEATDPRPARAD